MTPPELQRSKGCPDVDTLLSPPSSEVSAHLAQCPACRAELALRRSFEEALPNNAERADLDWMESRLRQIRPGLTPAKRWWHLPTVPRLALAATVALAVVTVAVQWNSRQVRPLDEPGSTGTAGTTGTVLRSSGGLDWVGVPAGELAQLPQRVEWTARPDASYVVELLEVDGAIAWKSAPTRETALSIPAEVQEIAGTRRTLAWRVKALDATGRVVAESERLTFRVSPTARP